jgi:two-component system CheB/CheR fusion protein
MNKNKIVKSSGNSRNKAPIKEIARFPVIAIGGSAGSLQAFDDFFSEIPIHTGFAFIIIMHLAPEGNINVPGLFQRFTAMPVIEANDGIKIIPNHVYIIPPNKNMGIHNNQLLLFKIVQNNGASQAIDFFLQSLAEERWNKAVAIIFSGMGNDGQLGIKMIKEKLGMVMVQNPDTAQYKDMPNAAIDTFVSDFVLHPKEMSAALIKYLNHPLLQDPVDTKIAEEEYHYTILQKILLLLRSHIGHDFTLYKKNTITRRIERRMAVYKLSDFESYFDLISDNPIEMDILFKEMLIGVTKFFRDNDSFESIRKLLYTRITTKNEDEPIRVWIAGCSTGEEAYSIAILVLEFLAHNPLRQTQKVQIFATDLDDAAIEFARLGCYSSAIASDVSPERLERFFSEKNKGYVVKKELREMIVFAKHNLIKDAPFTRLDLLSCRNVMIYFSASLQKKLLPVFHYSLNKNGLLFLGPAETVGIYNEAFHILDAKWKIFERGNGLTSISKMIDFPFNIATPNIKTLKLPNKPQIKTPMANSFHKILVDHYTPASLLVNEKGDILYINGNVNKYLSLNSGEAIMNVNKIIRDELRYPLGNAIHQAWLHKKNLDFISIKITENGKTYMVAFAVDYLKDTHLQGLLVITFKDQGEVKRRKKQSSVPTEDEAQVISDLESELIFTKQQLHSTIEQMESSLEELKSTNEELQSTNEELQSTNEEALTTKEEMQSLNEELMTINLQYHNKAEELTRLNNDMKNLLDNTEIGTIFLDNNLNILRFTPQVTKLFNVIPQDVGRSITHIVSNFDYPAIETAIVEVIERLAGKELEVKTKKNEWYNLRIMPYRTMDNFISGAVLTFTKITPLKSLETKLSNLLSYVQTVVDNLKDPALILSNDQKVLVVNKAFLKLFHLKDYEVREHFFMEIVVNRWKTDKLTDLFSGDEKDTSIYLEHEFPEIGLKKLTIELHYVKAGNNQEHATVTVVFKEHDPHEKQKR